MCQQRAAAIAWYHAGNLNTSDLDASWNLDAPGELDAECSGAGSIHDAVFRQP